MDRYCLAPRQANCKFVVKSLRKTDAMTHDGRLKPSMSNRHFGQEIERIRVEDLKFARQRRGHEDAFSYTAVGTNLSMLNSCPSLRRVPEASMVTEYSLRNGETLIARGRIP